MTTTGGSRGRRGSDADGVQRRVIPLVVVALVALLTGLTAGLARIGWPLPGVEGELMLRHGALMVVGFVGTVISVERAVAVRTRVAVAAPALSAGAAIALIVGVPPPVAPLLAAAAAVAYTATILTLVIRASTLPLQLMLVGGGCLAVAAIVWLAAGGLPRVVPWWIAFLVLTIAAERLELLRFQRVGRTALAGGAVALVLILAGPAVALGAPAVGSRMLGAGLVWAAAWLLVRDHARRGIWSDGMSRYVAIGLLWAYAWLGITGALLLVRGLTSAGWHYDAVVHAFFVGVVMSSILAHAPIIAPTITGLNIPFPRALYLPLVLLQGSLAGRLAGDLSMMGEVRRWSGLVQFVTILLLVVIIMRAVLAVRGRSAGPRQVGG